MQWLNRFVRCTGDLLESCMMHSFGMVYQFHRPLAVSEILLVSVNHMVLFFQRGRCLQLRGDLGL
jgi:hypothetical protein